MTRALANENISRDVVAALLKIGWDTVSVSDRDAGLDDRGVLERAWRERRLLITHDRDYGRLVFVDRLPVVGVILLRVEPLKGERAATLAGILASRTDWAGSFSVLERGRLRMIPLSSEPAEWP